MAGRDAQNTDAGRCGGRLPPPVSAVRSRIPIWLAAVLPGMAVAGEVSDFPDHPATSLDWLSGELGRPSARQRADRGAADLRSRDRRA